MALVAAWGKAPSAPSSGVPSTLKENQPLPESVACSRNSAYWRSPDNAISFHHVPLYEITAFVSGRVDQIFPSNMTAPPLSESRILSPGRRPLILSSSSGPLLKKVLPARTASIHDAPVRVFPA